MASLIDKYFPSGKTPITPTAGITTRQGGSLINQYFPSKAASVPEPEKISFSDRVKSFGSKAIGEVGKFVVRTGVEAANLFSSTLDFTADLLASEVEKQIRNPQVKIPGGPGISLPETKPTSILADKWKSFYENVEGKQTEKLKLFTQKLRSIDYIAPSPEWQQSTIQEKLTTRLPETILNIGPGIVASLAPYLVNPGFGFALSTGAVADDVKTVAIENGVQEDRAQALGLGTGLLVGWLDKIVPDELFTTNQKSQFISGFAKRVVTTGLKEAGTEVAQEDIQLLAEAVVRDDLSVDEVTERNIMAGLGGLLGGAGAQVPVSFVNGIKRGDIGGIDVEKLQSGVSEKPEGERRDSSINLDTSLIGEEAGDQEKAAEYVRNNFDEAMERYNARVKQEFGTTNVVSSDEAKYSLPDFSVTKSRSYHEPASALAKAKAQQLLADPENADKPILFMAGGSGSEKTTVVRENDNLSNYALVYDSNLNNFESAVEKIDPLIEAGREVKIDFVFRPIETAFEGVLKRVRTRGRIVPVEQHLSTHIGAIETLKKLNEKYGDKIGIYVFDNSGEVISDAKEADLSLLEDIRYNEGELRKTFNERLQKAVANEEITQEELSTFLPPGRIPQEARSGGAQSVQKSRTKRSSRRLNKSSQNEKPRKYKIIKQEGIVEVDGTPVKIMDGLDTFIHEGTGGWVISEVSSGRLIAVGKTQKEAITKAKKTIKAVGEEQVIKTVAEKQLSVKSQKKSSKKETPVKKPSKENVVAVPQSQLPIGDGKQKISRLEARMKQSLKNVTQENIDKLGLSTYQQINNKENVAKAAEYVANNPEEALKVIKGEIEPPKGMLRNSIYVALKNLGSADTDLATKIASLNATRIGQELSVLQEIDPDNPVTLMESVVNTRIEAIEKRTGKKIKEKIQLEIKKINAEAKAPSGRAWDTFLASITC